MIFNFKKLERRRAVEIRQVSRSVVAIAIGLGLAGVLAFSGRADDGNVAVTIKDHKFDPELIEIPSGAQVKLLVTNADETPEEFESQALGIEKVIPGGQKAEIKIGPLSAGTYEFVGEFHEDSAKGKIVAK